MTDEEIVALINNKKGKRIAKNGSLLLLGVIAFFGIIGSFDVFNFNMSSFVMFLKEFKGILITFIGSIGTGLAVKTYVEGGKE